MSRRSYPLSPSLEGGQKDEDGAFPAASEAQPRAGVFIPRTEKMERPI